MQYMSQATGWADSFTLAMAPLGILTIIVSAIRVGGPSWLKAIIGRARENFPVAEVELMSSNSVDVCELWNGSEIVRSLGSPPVREFILLIPKSRKDATRPFDFECKNIQEAERDGFLTTSNGMGDSEKGMSMGSSEPTDSHEIELEDLNRSEKVIIIYNESISAPNISLNVHPQNRAEVRAAAVIGTFLQLGVLIYAGFATYYHTLRFPKEEDKPVSNYAFPCTASGTIILVTGLLLCADVVEKRTVEMARKPRVGYDAYPMWLQRQATVGDQVFKSFGIFSDEPRKEVVTSRRDDISMVASKATEVSFLDRVVQVVCYLPFRIQKLLRPKSESRTSLFAKQSVQFSKTTLGAFLSISGYIVQFVGLRDMHWSVSIVQLGAVLIMTVARAAIRRGLAVPPRTQSLSQDFELEWLASIITGIDSSSLEIPEIESPLWINWVVLGNEGFNLESLKDKRKDGEIEDDSEDDSENDSENESKDNSEDNSEGDSKDDGQAISDKEEGINDGAEEANCDRADGDASNNSEDAQTNHGIYMEHHGGSVAARNNEGHTRTTYSKPQTVMTLRSYFGEVTGWRSPIFAEANSLSRAIEVVMNTLFLESGLEHFDWQFKAMCNGSDSQIITVPMSVTKGNWKVSRHDIEAILSLWIFSMKNTSREGNTLQTTDINTDRPGLHLLGLDTPQLRRDLQWWVPRDLQKIIIVRESSEGSLVVEKSLVVGCRRATQKAVRLERIQLGDDDSDPPYGQAVERGLLAVESFAPPATLYALDLFSSFVRAVARAMEKPINGQGEVRPNDPGNLDGSEIQSTGLATLSEVYSATIPSLSIENKLPLVDPIIELAREHARPHEERGVMKKVTEVYLWLIKTARLFPHDTSFVWKSTAVTVEHLGELIMSAELSDRLKPIAPPPPDDLEHMFRTPNGTHLHQRIEDELQLGEPESRSLFIRLMLLYGDQNHLHKIPSRFVMIANRDPAFVEQRRSTQRIPPREVEEGIEKRDLPGWTELHREAVGKNPLSLADLLENDLDPDIQDLVGQTALHLACQDGRVDTATILTRHGADVNARARNGSTPLHYAARKGFMSIVKLLVESGAEFDEMDSARMTPAMWAALEGKKEVLSYLWKNTNFNLRDKGGRTMLHHAVLGGSCGIVGVVEIGIDTEVRDHQGRTPLHLAALHGNEDALSILCTKLKADMGAKDNTGKRLLHLAAVGGLLTIMSKLVSTFNADVNCVDDFHETPLHLAVREEKETVVEHLIKLEANLEAKGLGGQTPLMIACILGRIKTVKRLVDLGANTDTLTNLKSSTLSEAARHGYRKVVEYLLTEGVNKDSQEWLGRTALHVAAMNGRRHVVKLLIAAGAEKEMSDYEGRTPLHHAAREGYSAVARVLLMADAVKDAKDNRGMTPLHYAAQRTTPRYMEGLKRGYSDVE
ncbi:hypothetical protein FPRO04_09784 [Fusarium proliferatum]|nr:hypothetical protein FPRO04_09784 [Fusarium proliferatum]